MLPAIIGGFAGLGSALIGRGSSGGDRDAAMALAQLSIQDYEAMGLPKIEAQRLALEELRSQGQLTPELEQMITLGPSATGEISLDPAYKAAQMRALDELSAIGEGGGMRLSDAAALEDVMGKVRSSERGSREAILANQRERGVAGSGSELAAQLANQQNSAQNAYAQGLGVAANAQDRALEAIIQGGSLAGDIRGQEFGEEYKKASAADEIARFNAQNQIGMGTRNVDRRNLAQQQNLGESQRIADANVGLRNDQQQFNKGLIQQNFNNQLAVNQAKANARSAQSSNLQNQANATQQMWGGIGQGLNQIGTQIATNQSANNTSGSANRDRDREDLLAKIRAGVV